MKKLSRKHKIALVELVLVLLLAGYLFGPRGFSGAMGGDFVPAEMEQVQILLQGSGEHRNDDRSILLTPDQPAYQELIAKLESKRYVPYYLESKQRDVTLDYWVTMIFTLPDGRGMRTYAFSGDRAVDTAGSDTRDRTFQLWDSVAFQQSVLDFLLEQEYTVPE